MITIAIILLAVLGVVIFLICRNASGKTSGAGANRSHAADMMPILIAANVADTARHGCDASTESVNDGGNAGGAAESGGSGDCGGGSDGGGGGGGS